MKGIDLIAKERKEQNVKYIASFPPDDKSKRGVDIIDAVKRLLEVRPRYMPKPFGFSDGTWTNMVNKSYYDRLIIAGALIAAELDRFAGEVKTMNFSEALIALKSGKKVKRQLWQFSHHVEMINEQSVNTGTPIIISSLVIHEKDHLKASSNYYAWTPDSSDMMAEDWIEV